MAGANASNHLKFITRYIYVARDIYLYIKTSNNEESSFLKEKWLACAVTLLFIIFKVFIFKFLGPAWILMWLVLGSLVW